jgi:hypothetical protein
MDRYMVAYRLVTQAATRLLPKLALTTAAALGVYAATLGLPMLGSCDGVAGAAPSPTCGGDLRECLRLSAKTGIYGARYVTADDVARCVEAFDACIHGTLHGNPNPPTSTSTGGSRKGLPQHFAIRADYGFVSDCRVDGDAVTCSQSWETPPDWVDSYTGTVTGRLSGLTVTGTQTLHQSGTLEQGCTIDETYSGPITYTFNRDGTVKLAVGPAWVPTSSSVDG